MLRELLSIFRTSDPLRVIGESFAEMLQLTYQMTVSAGEMLVTGRAAPEARTRVYQQDVQVNHMQRAIRKRVVSHLSVPGNTADVPYCLLLMSLVKDVERIGDYSKNLSEVTDVRHGPLPDDDLAHELREIAQGVEGAFQRTLDVFQHSNQERAIELIQEGRDIAHRCDVLIGKIAQSTHDAATTAALVLATRYYKRISGHVLNVLSSVVMPLHKVDYYDEDEIPAGVKPASR